MTGRTSALALFLLVGCSNKLSGSFEIEGKTFTPTSCSNMIRIGARGVELVDDSERKVRVLERPDGSADLFWFAKASGKGTKFTDCATLTIRNQNSSVNKVKNVMGKVTLDCHRDEELTGTVTFENCH